MWIVVGAILLLVAMGKQSAPASTPPAKSPGGAGDNGGSDSTAADATPAQTQSLPAQQYTVVSGDSISGIAQSQYGDSTLWPLIYDANKATCSGNPNVIQPGWIFNIYPLGNYTADQQATARSESGASVGYS